MFLRSIATATAALTLACIAVQPAAAEQIRQHSVTLPDGHVVGVVEYTTSGFSRHQTRLQIPFTCDPGPVNCRTEDGFQTSDGGLASIIIPSGAVVAAAHAVRPSRVETNNNTFSSAYQNQQSDNNNQQLTNPIVIGGGITNGPPPPPDPGGGKG